MQSSFFSSHISPSLENGSYSNDLSFLLQNLSEQDGIKLILPSEDGASSKLIDSATQVTSALQYSIPDTKLFYPEPFLASPSYMHSDLTFLHILQY